MKIEERTSEKNGSLKKKRGNSELEPHSSKVWCIYLLFVTIPTVWVRESDKPLRLYRLAGPKVKELIKFHLFSFCLYSPSARLPGLMRLLLNLF